MRNMIYLADINSRPIPNTAGREEKYVSKMTAVTADVLNVGQNTYWSAQAAGIVLSYSIEVRRSYFNNEKYLFTCGKLYEIVNIGKAKDVNDILLNVKDLDNSEIETAIKRWINENPIV